MSAEVLDVAGHSHGRARIAEAAAGVGCVLVAVLYGLFTGWDATVPAMAAFFATMATATVIDLRERRVPNRLLVVATPLVVVLFVLAEIAGGGAHLAGSLIGGAILFAVFLVIHLISPKSFGAGDVKISFLIGVAVCWFGLGQIQWFLIWMWLGLAVIGVPILRKKGRGSGAMLPLVPILSGAAVLTILLAAAN